MRQKLLTIVISTILVNSSVTLAGQHHFAPLGQGYQKSSAHPNSFDLNTRVVKSAMAMDQSSSGVQNRPGNAAVCSGCVDGEVNLDSFSSLNAALTNIGANYVTLIISSPKQITSTVIIPSNVVTRFTGAGLIAVAKGAVLEINGPLEAPLRQIFAGHSKVRFGSEVGVAYPQWWGARMTGNANDAAIDTAAIQGALDAFNQDPLVRYQGVSHAGVVEITGGAYLESTLIMHYSSLTLRGQGWGTSARPPYRSFLKSTEKLKGLPMIQISDCWRTGIENLRLIGNSSNKPSAAIDFHEVDDSAIRMHGLDFSFLRGVYIGEMGGYDTDFQGHQFETGILFSGSLDGDSNYFEHVSVNGCDVGIDVRNHNAGDTHWDSLVIINCGTGFRAGSFAVGTNWLFASNDVDINLALAGSKVSLRHVGSEGSKRFATLTGSGVQLIVLGGTWQAGDNFIPADIANDRWFIDAEGSYSQYVHLEDFEITTAGTAYKNPVVRIGNSGGASGSFLRLINTNLSSTNIRTEPVGLNFRNYGLAVESIQRVTAGVQSQIYSRVLLDASRSSEDNAFQSYRNDFAGKVNIFGGPLKVKAVYRPVGVSASPVSGSGTSTYSYRVTALTYDGETDPSIEATCTNQPNLDSTHKNRITWHQAQGAYAYNIYGRTSGNEQLLATLPADQVVWTNGFVDDGSRKPDGPMPVRNTTGNLTVEGMFSSGYGAPVASSSTIVPTGNTFHVTGKKTISGINGRGIPAGTTITIIFDGGLVVTDGGNLKLAGNLIATPDSTITLVWDGSNWYERSRSIN